MRTIMTDKEAPTGELETRIKENPENDLEVIHSQHPTDTTADSIEKPIIEPPEEKTEIQNNEHTITKEENNSLTPNQNDDDCERDLTTQENQTKQETPERSEKNQENNNLTNKTNGNSLGINSIPRKKKPFILPTNATSRAPETD
ncbi:hypothetical protein D3C84_896110 [compost metagenome]